MSDHDHVQMNAIKAVYPVSTLLLCWWHVLRAMKTLGEWVKTPDQTQFESWWEEMQANPTAPQSLIDYLRVNGMPVVSLWAGSARKNRTIFQEGDTNMLIEA
jgi:hypothetical protein